MMIDASLSSWQTHVRPGMRSGVTWRKPASKAIIAAAPVERSRRTLVPRAYGVLLCGERPNFSISSAGVGFILMLALSAYWEPGRSMAPLFQAWMYIATIVLGSRKRLWGYFIGFSGRPAACGCTPTCSRPPSSSMDCDGSFVGPDGALGAARLADSGARIDCLVWLSLDACGAIVRLQQRLWVMLAGYSQRSL